VNELLQKSLHEVVMHGMSQTLYRRRQAWACGMFPHEPWMNPYVRRTGRMAEIMEARADKDLWRRLWEIEDRADRWEHREILPEWVRDAGICAEID